MRTRYQGFSTATHSRCEQLYNEGMSFEDIQTLMAREAVATQEEQVRDVYTGLGDNLYKASGSRKVVKQIIEAIKTRITRKRRNILKD
jgi:hypothetical protein